MGWFSYVAIYFVIWWLCLFVVLPFGIRSQEEAGETVVQGNDRGAPAVPRVWLKLAITSVLAAVVMAAVLWGLSNPALQEYWR